jgi:hypothetical protein
MGTERMTTDRIPDAIEKPFRKALGHAIRNEFSDFRKTLRTLDDQQVSVYLGLCAYIAGFVAIDVSGRQ